MRLQGGRKKVRGRRPEAPQNQAEWDLASQRKELRLYSDYKGKSWHRTPCGVLWHRTTFYQCPRLLCEQTHSRSLGSRDGGKADGEAASVAGVTAMQERLVAVGMGECSGLEYVWEVSGLAS